MEQDGVTSVPYSCTVYPEVERATDWLTTRACIDCLNWLESYVKTQDFRNNGLSCGVCGGSRKVTQNVNCSHGLASNHWRCGHGDNQSANYHT